MNKTRIGLVGIGLMGLAMAQRLLENNCPVTVYNRTAAKLALLAETEAVIAASVAEVINNSDCIILMLTDRASIAEVLFSEPLPDFSKKIIIQMGTISPSDSRAIAEMVSSVGGEYLEAPVLGSIPEAKKGELIVMVGGDRALFDRAISVLKNFSSEPQYIGATGSAAALKLALNQLISGLTASFALSLAAVVRSRIDVDQFMRILRESALYAPTFDKKLSRMLDRDYDNPNFPTKHLFKDTDLFLQMATELGLDGESAVGVRKIIAKSMELGMAEGDYSAIFEAIER